MRTFWSRRHSTRTARPSHPLSSLANVTKPQKIEQKRTPSTSWLMPPSMQCRFSDWFKTCHAMPMTKSQLCKPQRLWKKWQQPNVQTKMILLIITKDSSTDFLPWAIGSSPVPHGIFWWHQWWLHTWEGNLTTSTFSGNNNGMAFVSFHQLLEKIVNAPKVLGKLTVHKFLLKLKSNQFISSCKFVCDLVLVVLSAWKLVLFSLC